MVKHSVLKVSTVLVLILFVMLVFAACGGTENNITFSLMVSFMVDDSVYEKIESAGTTAITMPDDPAKDGYTFDGWYWDDGKWEKPFTANSLLDTPLKSSMSVYAKLTPVAYTITYQADGGIHQNPSTYTIEDNFSLLPAEKEGYTFEGWYNGDTKVTEIAVGSKGNLTLTAHWSLTTYQITYENTKGTENKNPDTYTIESEAIALSAISADGYTFDGWYNGSTKVTEIAKGSTGNITLTAKWTLNGYTISYHNVDGATHENPESYNVEVEPLELMDASKIGYTFLGWYTKDEGGEELTEIAVGTVVNLDLYARWEAITYTATFKIDGEIVAEIPFTVETVALEEPALPERSGYTAAWESYTLTADDITINAVYTPITYTITYLNTKNAENANRTEYSIETPTFALSDISVTGYTFYGWYDGETKVTQISQGTTGSIELTAHWTPVTYGITYNLNGGYESSNRRSYSIETNDFTLSDASKNGYTFLGWTWEDQDEPVKRVVIPKGSCGEKAFTANWSEPIVYAITYNLNGGEMENNPNPMTYTIESETILVTGTPTKSNYIFAGWSPATIPTGSYGSKTVTAQWEAIFNVSGNSITGLTSAGKTLAKIEIPSEINGVSITSIGNSAFSGCSGLTSVTIPNSVTSIGNYVFDGCSGLTSITVDEENPNYCSVDGILYNKEKSQIIYVPKAIQGNITIPNSVTSIGGSAFRNCSELTSVTIGNSVTSIGNSAFSSCSGLTTVNWNATNCTSAGISNSPIFKNCTNLKAINIGENVTTIPAYAFSGCSGLTSITIPNSVTSIGGDAFRNCSELQAVYITDLAKWCSIAFGGYSANPLCYAKNLYLNGELVAGDLVIPEGVTSIGDGAFRNCSGLTSVTIPNSVTSIGVSAFSNCSGLTSVTIPNNVTRIEVGVFSGCSGLTSVTIPNSVTSIGNAAFAFCTGLTSITIPNSVTNIEMSAFFWCYGLTSVTFENPSGWYVTETPGATSGIDIDVTDTSTNVLNIRDNEYSGYYWYRK